MDILEKFPSEYLAQCPDEYIVQTTVKILDRVINERTKYPDTASIAGTISFGRMREMEGFYTHQGFMEGVLTVIVAECISQFTHNSHLCQHRRNETFTQMFFKITMEQVDRCISRVLDEAEVKFGKPKFVDEQKIDRYIRMTVVAGELTSALAGLFTPSTKTKHHN